jgi:hypothetical protein
MMVYCVLFVRMVINLFRKNVFRMLLSKLVVWILVLNVLVGFVCSVS